MNRAFTLLELSIVLVIIGLIVGGVVAGQELIRNAELNSVTTDINRFSTAINNFKFKYNALPGDFSNAKSYWPDDSQYTGFVTLNGDGDGVVTDGGLSDEVKLEATNAWEHLSLANLLDGNYSGIDLPNISAGGVIPKGSINGSQYCFMNNGGGFTGGVHQSAQLILQYGKGTVGSSATGCADRSIVSPQEALSLDTKVDDGVALEGKWRAINGSSAIGSCLINQGTDNSYAMDNEGLSCRLFINML